MDFVSALATDGTLGEDGIISKPSTKRQNRRCNPTVTPRFSHPGAPICARTRRPGGIRLPARILGILLLLAAFAPGPVALAQEVEWSGQFRPRFEGRDPSAFGEWDHFTSMRTRFGARVGLSRGVSFFGQLQDVHVWGTGSSTLDTGVLELHQGYANLDFQGDWTGFLRVGRQEIEFGAGRLVGAPVWGQRGRSFDAARVQVGRWGHTLNAFVSKISEVTVQNPDLEASFAAIYGDFDLRRAGRLEAYWLFGEDLGEGSSTRESTAGGRWTGRFGLLDFEAEGAWQGGTRNSEDLDAFLFTAHGGGALGESGLSVHLWWDYLSGDDDLEDGVNGSFNPTFGRGHRFYGFYDLWIRIEEQTQGHGLQDLSLKTRFARWESWDLLASYHQFRAAAQRDLSTTRYADELDIVAQYFFSPEVTLSLQYAYVWAKAGVRELGLLSNDGKWLAVQLDLQF